MNIACAREFTINQGSMRYQVFRLDMSDTFHIYFQVGSWPSGWTYGHHVDKPHGMPDSEALDTIESFLRGEIEADDYNSIFS